MPESNYRALLDNCSKRIKENEESLAPMISEIIKEIHELAELAPKDEEKEEKKRWSNSRYANESMVMEECCEMSGFSLASEGNEAENGSNTEASEADIIPDDLELEH